MQNLKWIHVPHIGIERLPMQYLKEEYNCYQRPWNCRSTYIRTHNFHYAYDSKKGQAYN